MKKIIYAVLFVGIAVLTVSCCACRKKAPAVEMIGSRWLLTDIGGKVISRIDGANVQEKYSLEFGVNNRFSGMGDCNRFFGPYTIDTANKTVEFGNAGVSMMMCLNQEGENAYFNMLTLAKSYDVDGDYFMLKDEAGVVIATFKADNTPRPEPEQ